MRILKCLNSSDKTFEHIKAKSYNENQIPTIQKNSFCCIIFNA